MVLGGSRCLDVLRAARRELERMDIRSLLDEERSRLVVPFRTEELEVLYNAVCMDKRRVRIVSVVKSVEEKLESLNTQARLNLLRKLLQVPADLKISVALDSDGDLLFEPWASSLHEANKDNILHSLYLTMLFTKWLEQQLENARQGKPLEDFKLETR